MSCYVKWSLVTKTVIHFLYQTNVILQYKLLAGILSAACSVIQQS